ncbi:MAG TPA: energy transducer TonB [Candidatus Eisenbacteria bacterium]
MTPTTPRTDVLTGPLPLAGERHPLNRDYVRWLTRGNATALGTGLVLFAAWWLWSGRKPVEPVARPVRLVRYAELSEPPSIAAPAPPQIQVQVAAARAVAAPTIAIPEPVPMAEVQDTTIATQEEMAASDIPAPVTTDAFGVGSGDSLVVGGAGGGGGGIGGEGEGDGHPSPEDFVAVESDPERLRMDTPVYPPVALQAGVEGTVMVQALVSKEGKVLKVRVLEGPEMLHESAIACAKTAIFRPALAQNKPVEVWVVMPITFKLRK